MRAPKLCRVVLSLASLAIAACGGISGGEWTPAGSSSGDAATDVRDVSDDGGADSHVTPGCPSTGDVSSLVGTPCSSEGLTCGGDRCTDPCSFCNLVRCTGGAWTQEEAFPDPNCNDATDAPACSYPPANNDPRCPSSYSYSYGGQPCSPIGLGCAYPGEGDGESNGCYATAMMWCTGDGGLDGGGSGTWTVAQ